MNRELRTLSNIYKQKRYSKIENVPTDKMLKVDSAEVTKVIKKNHSYLSCNCTSSGKTGHHSLCIHKRFFILFPFFEELNKHLDKLIKDYERFQNIGKLEPYAFVNDLKNLKRSFLK